MSGPFTALDHVALAVRDVDAASDGYAALFGRTPEWRGESPGSEHVWFQLGNTALDIVSGAAVARRLEAGEGLWGAALATPDLAEARRRLDRVSVKSTEPVDVATTRTGGTDSRSWLTSIASAKAVGGASLFLVQEQATALPPAPFAADEASCVSGLDHIVVRTANPERAIATYGARLGLDMRLDRSNPEWGTRLMFFRLGDLVVEVMHDLKTGVSEEPDSLWGLSWRAPDVLAARSRMAAAGLDVSELRKGRKPGTQVFTVRGAPAGVPTLIIGQSSEPR